MADTEIDSKIEIIGLDNIKAKLEGGAPLALKLEGGAPVALKLEGGTQVKLENVYDIKPLEIKPLEIKPLKADLGTTTHLTIDPLKLELAPLKSDQSMTLDLKPAVIDLCLTANLGKLPNVCIRQPYHHHIGFTLFGTEVWGYTFSGQQETVIEELDRQPQVAWRGAVATWPPHRPPHSPSASPAPQPPSRQAGGLRVRLNP
jgi:hypothetical protein